MFPTVGNTSCEVSHHRRLHHRYAGSWERNMYEGHGVWVSADGFERYIGCWQKGRKHGYGR